MFTRLSPVWRQKHAAQSGPMPRFFLRDDFTADLPAGAVHNTLATDGLNPRSVVDAGSRLSLSGGEALFALGGSSSDPRLTYPAVTAAPGLCFFATLRQNADATENIVLRAGFDSAATGAVDNLCFEFTASAVLNARWTSTLVQNVGLYARLVNYQVAIVILETQARWFIKGGAWSTWTQLHSQATTLASNHTTVYPAITCYNRLGACPKLGVAVLPGSFQLDTLALGPAETAILDGL